LTGITISASGAWHPWQVGPGGRLEFSAFFLLNQNFINRTVAGAGPCYPKGARKPSAAAVGAGLLPIIESTPGYDVPAVV
jgi:hypothetical protein